MGEKKQHGVVVATRGRLFEVRAEDGDHYHCEVRRRVKGESDRTTPVAVGDDVEFTRTHEGGGAIDRVIPRRSAFVRPATGDSDVMQVIAANLDQLAVVTSVKSPPLKTGLIDRCLIAAYLGSMEPMIVINKIDLHCDESLEEVIQTYRECEYAVFPVSAKEGTGLDDLRRALVDHRTLFAGHSGVGKSTLLNTLIPGLDLKTLKISQSTKRGRHATTSIELFELPQGGFVVDSPGLKVMGLWEVTVEELPHYWPEFEPFARECRFQPCSHTHEPGCAVKKAVRNRRIAQFRWDNYCSIAASLTEDARSK